MENTSAPVASGASITEWTQRFPIIRDCGTHPLRRQTLALAGWLYWPETIMSGSESGTADPYAVRGVAAAPEAGTRKVFPGGPRAESRWLHGIILLSIPALV